MNWIGAESTASSGSLTSDPRGRVWLDVSGWMRLGLSFQVQRWVCVDGFSDVSVEPDLAERAFDVRQVVAAHLDIYQDVIKTS